MHAIEKILTTKAGLDKVKAGDIVNYNTDFVEINDLYLQTVYSFWEMGGKDVFDKDKIVFIFDHYSPYILYDKINYMCWRYRYRIKKLGVQICF